MLERSVVESLDRFRTYLFRNYSQNLQQARRELPYYLSIQTVSTSADIVSLPYLFTIKIHRNALKALLSFGIQ